MIDSAFVEYSTITEGPGGVEYEAYLPYGEVKRFMISDRECAILRRSRLDTLEQYVLDYVQLQNKNIEHIKLVQR